MTQHNSESTSSNGWSQYQKLVLETLDRLERKHDAMDEKLTNLRIDVARKGAMWGAIGGIIASIATYLLSR